MTPVSMFNVANESYVQLSICRLQAIQCFALLVRILQMKAFPGKLLESRNPNGGLPYINQSL